ncbi:MAG TPA: DUF3616 domain-containing protein [Kofleriaceae bacterium]
MNRGTASIVFAQIALVISCAPESGTEEVASAALLTVTAFQDGTSPTSTYFGTRDTMLEQDNPSTNHGLDTKLSVSGDTPGGSGKDDVALLQWDLTSIPRAAIVHAATLTLTVTDKADQPYALFEMLRGWDEDTGTWKRASTPVNWETNGAEGATDRATTPLGLIRAPSTGTFTIVLNSIGVSVVQRWVTDPSKNHGLIIAGTDNDNRLEFQSREGSRSGRPRLDVSWEPGSGGGLDPTSGTYQQTCDGSGAIAVDSTHFVDFSDEDQAVRIYTRAAGAAPVQQLDISTALGMTSSDEADLEDAARVGNRVYAITSHGRDKDGVLTPTRYRFLAIDLSGAVPSLHMTVAGSSGFLLDDLLDAANWDHPDPAIIAALQAASQLSRASDPNLSPEVQGINIEGLASYPSPTNPDRLIIGFRNPQASGRAILVTLLNPAQVIAGGFARFGEAIQLDLGGLGVRAMAWSDAHQALLLIGGPVADVGAVRLFKWSGDPASTPTIVQDLVGPAATAPEAVVPYPGTKDVQILFDFGGLLINGTECKKLSASAQSFTDVIVHVD